MKRWKLAALLGAILLFMGLLQGCTDNSVTTSSGIVTDTIETSRLIDEAACSKGEAADPGMNTADTAGEPIATLATEPAELENDEDFIAAASMWIKHAFGIDIPEIEGLTSDIWYESKDIWHDSKELVRVNFRKGQEVHWVVQFGGGSKYPKCLYYYHYHHLYDESFDIAQDDAFQFNEDSIE